MPARPTDSADSPQTSRSAPPEIRILEARYGTFPEVDELNRDFIAGSRRLKLQIEVHEGIRYTESDPAVLLEQLSESLPGLDEHRCCGNSEIGSTFFRNGDGDGSTEGARLASANLAHLLEHVVLDLQYRIAGATRCSAVTCGYWEPPSRYDLFVESSNALCAGTSARLGVALMNDHLAGHPAIPLYGLAIRVGRELYERHPWPRGDAELAASLEEPAGRVQEITRHLRERSVVEEVLMTVNFGGGEQYGLAATPFPWRVNR
ncbi:MAG: hypothetical protein O7H41_04315 [Planctomycetota bacterium]|nr:hypothetical protein [Planctomycetota bacterium]